MRDSYSMLTALLHVCLVTIGYLPHTALSTHTPVSHGSHHQRSHLLIESTLKNDSLVIVAHDKAGHTWIRLTCTPVDTGEITVVREHALPVSSLSREQIDTLYEDMRTGACNPEDSSEERITWAIQVSRTVPYDRAMRIIRDALKYTRPTLITHRLSTGEQVLYKKHPCTLAIERIKAELAALQSYE